MKLLHLGKIIEIEPRQAAIENRIVRMLNRHSTGVRQSKLFSLTGSGRFGIEAFNQACERLIDEEGVVVRATTHHEQGFLLKLTPWGEHQALDLEETLSAGRKGSVA